MRHPRLVRYLICPAILLAPVSGCAGLSNYRPVSVLAKDAETGNPIPGVEVRLTYPHGNPSNAPSVSSAITGTDGIAHLHASPSGDFDLSMAGSANNYMPEERAIPVKTVAAIEPAHLFEQVELRPVQFVLAMYSGPHPTVELVVPEHYRGEVKVEILTQDHIPCPPGQRCFSFPVGSSGAVEVIGPALLRRVSFQDIIIKDVNGVQLSREATESEIGFWYVKGDGNDMYLFLGSLKEYITQYPDVVVKTPHTGVTRSSGNGQGGGRGRRNRGDGDTLAFP
jgi:hypothetical protein